MTTAVAMTNGNGAGALTDYSADWAANQNKLDLLKRTYAEGTSNDEFALFVQVAKASGLNPFQRQIYAIMRKSYNPQTKQTESKMTIQTGIDGYRLIAARTGQHAGTSEAEYGAEVGGYPSWAKVTVRKIVSGMVAEFTATARWSEYAQTKDEYADGRKTGRQTLVAMWRKMPYSQLGKCAEALALRKGFPAELSGVYTADEMAQADNVVTVEPQRPPARYTDHDRTIDTRTGEVITPEQSKTESRLAHESLMARFVELAKEVPQANSDDANTGRKRWLKTLQIDSVKNLAAEQKRKTCASLENEADLFRSLVLEARDARWDREAAAKEAAESEEIPEYDERPQSQDEADARGIA